ncbi:S8 family serine peptidase [Kallotenue papyrolyticum]|uniref:S8 family serine peptidase n=1 Tax=Kallotenue papyrolyticum TaxID=1325125 RepID=UPI000492485C|nr:S8 family serine peptidase [Kallotenue papyrolyticum]
MGTMARWIGTVLALVLALAVGLPVGRAQAAGVEIDPLLTQQLARVAPDASLQAILTFDHKPTVTDVAAARGLGLLVHEFSVLPMLAVQGTPAQVRAALSLPGLVSAYYNKQLRYLLHESVPLIGADRVWRELGYTGKGVGVAVIDSGIDATHPDLTFGTVTVQNVKIVGPNFFSGDTVIVENLPNSDTTSGHGTHVAGTIAGRGTASGGYYTGVAPGAHLIGIGAGDALFILFALQSFDYVLANAAKYNIKVISNSWGSSGAFSPGDPINVASKLAHDQGITVVFAAGNEGPAQNTLNPYAVAPWVIGVAAGNKDGKTLADFSSRGIPGDALYHPTITAPGVNIVSTRGLNTVLPVLGVTDDASINPAWIPYYTTMSGTSMATPHVSGVLALMLEANSRLGPDILKDLLVKTATPMPGYQEFEVGAGYVNAYQAVAEAKITSPKYGQVKGKDGKTYKTISQTITWNGVVGPSVADVYQSDWKDVQVSDRAIKMTVKIAWSNPVVDLDLYVYDPAGAQEGSSAQGLTAEEQTTVTTLDGSYLPAGTHRVEARGYLTLAEAYTGSATIEYVVGRGK